MTLVKTNGIEVAYDRFGDETAEAILLIAGLGTQMIRWTVPFCQELVSRGYHVIRFDNRDSGCSTHFPRHRGVDFGALSVALISGQRPDIPYTLHDMADDAIALLDALSIDRAHFVGRSMGGMIAQLAASEYPDRVLSLTSIMSSSGNPALPPVAPDLMAMMTRPAPNPFEDEAGYLQHCLSFAQRIAGHGYPFEQERHRNLILEEVQRAYDPSGFERQIAAIAVSGDRRPRLARITAPSLVIHGSDDPLFVAECGRDTASSIPGAEFLLVEGMGHELPSPLYREIAGAIDRVAKTNRAPCD